MKKFIFLLIILIPLIINAQDKVYKSDGSQIEAKVLEITTNEIKYKKYSNLDGPLYTISKSEVLLIVYENGESEVFNTKNSIEKKDEKIINQLEKYGRHLLSIDLIHPNFMFIPMPYQDQIEKLIYSGAFTISYENFSNNGKFGIRIPLHFITLWGVGMDLKFYPAPQKVSYFLGSSTLIAMQRIQTKYPICYYDFNGNCIENYEYVRETYVIIAERFINGVSFQTSKSFNVTFDGGIGPGVLIRKNGVIMFLLSFRIGITLGLRG